jgi:hypothetical protein
LLSFGEESFVLQFATQNFKDIYRTIRLPVVLYGCETWSLTLKEERKLTVIENRVLRIIFGPKGDEITVDWQTLHNEEVLCSSPSIVRVIKSKRMSRAGV